MTNTITDALRAAIDMISIDQQSFLDLNMRPDGSIHAGYEPILRKYDDALDKLRAALVAADHDAVRIMQTAVEKGHNYALVVDRLK